MKNKILQIITNWDPIKLSKIAPADEYSSEADEIVEFLNKNPNVDVKTLALKIDEIFNEWFEKKF